MPIGVYPRPPRKPCSIEGCGKPAKARGWCGTHYHCWRRTGNPLPTKSTLRTCSVEEESVYCGRPARKRGWCTMHYQRWQATGDPLGKIASKPAEQRFWPRVDKNGPVLIRRPVRGPCWMWTGTRTKQGYGKFYAFETRMLAHHFLTGKPPELLEYDHLCRNPSCVNPDHLELVTRLINMRRGAATGGALWVKPTHCKRGHELTPENICRNGKRFQCRICRNERQRQRTASLPHAQDQDYGQHYSQ